MFMSYLDVAGVVTLGEDGGVVVGVGDVHGHQDSGGHGVGSAVVGGPDLHNFIAINNYYIIIYQYYN